MNVSIKKSPLTIGFNEAAYIKRDGFSEDCILVDEHGGKHILALPWKKLKENFQNQLVYLLAEDPERKRNFCYQGVDLLIPAYKIINVEIESFPMSDPTLHVETPYKRFIGFYDCYDYPTEIPEQLKKFAHPKIS
jgi:hypothetical protein